MSLQAGAVVGNNIRLIRPLKRGGMGSVWLAEHQTLRMQVAVKFMAERLVQDNEYVERFAREAMSSAQIKSPHVVQVFDHGVADGTPFIVMELLEGEDLRARLSRAGPISIAEAVPLMVQLSRALTKAHAAGIVHRDIKPDNIFLVEHDGEAFIKVLDFGVAKHAAQDSEFGMTGTGAMVGTPHYMSPEQILSARRVDHRADLWSVGVVMYRALTGGVPFTGETLGAVCVAIERAEFIPASQRRPDLPRTLDMWFKVALTRDPAHRYQSAKEMADAFVSAIGAGGHAMAAFSQPESSSHGAAMPPAVPAGFSAPPLHASLPSNPWATNPLSPAVPAGHAHAASSSDLPAQRLPSAAAGPHVPDSSWPSPAESQQAPQPHTYPGASITHVERGGSSNRTLIAVASATLGLIVVVVILVALLVNQSGPPVATTAAPSPIESTSSAPPAPTTEAPVVPASTTSAAPPVASALAPPATANTAVVKPNSTVKPRRDRGF